MATVDKYFKVTKIKQHRGFIDHTKGTTYDDGAIELGSSNSGSDEDLVALPGTAQGIVELAQQLSGKKRSRNERPPSVFDAQLDPPNPPSDTDPVYFGIRDYKVHPLVHQFTDSIKLPVTNMNPFWAVNLTKTTTKHRVSDDILAERESLHDKMKQVQHTSLTSLSAIALPKEDEGEKTKRSFHNDPATIRIVKAIFFLDLDIDVYAIKRYILDATISAPASRTQTLTIQKLMQKKAPLQKKLLGFIESALEKATQLYQQLLSSDLTYSELEGFFLALFDMDPHYTASRFLSALGDAIDITGIYARDVEGGVWRSHIRRLFAVSCRIVWRWRVDPETKVLARSGEMYKELTGMWCREVGEWGRDAVLSVPVVPLRSEAAGSRRKRKRVD